MNENFIHFLIAADIAGLVVDLIIIFSKLSIFRTLTIAKKDSSISLKKELWIAGILITIVALYFISI